MSTINLAIAIASGVFLAIGLLSRKLINRGFAPPLLATFAGAFVGFAGLHAVVVPTDVRNQIVDLTARLSLAIALTGTALSLPKGEMLRRKSAILVILGLGMSGMWIASTFIIYGIMRTSFQVALLAGATVTPTDPVLARSVSEGELAKRFIPARLRYLLLGESELNDGLAYPIVLFAVTLLTPRGLFHYWTVEVVLRAVIGGAILGLGIGLVTGWLFTQAEKHGFVVRRYFLAMTLFMSFFSLALGSVFQMDGIFTVAFAALAFRFTGSDAAQKEGQEIQIATDLIFTLPVFFLLGLVLPWHEWIGLGWRVAAVGIAIVVLRRIPVVLIFWRAMQPEISSWREALFAGWFGPMGVSTFFYVVFALEMTHISVLWPIVTMVIAMSVVLHGLSSAPLTKALGHWEEDMGWIEPEPPPSNASEEHAGQEASVNLGS